MPTVRRKRPHIDVMVSSTSLDLPEHREAVIDAIFRVKMFPLAMEALTASPYNAIRYSLDMVDDAEVYVGVFGFRYGYRPDDPERNPERRSITELEYRRAVERGIPILIFLMDDKHPVPVSAGDAKNFFEQDPESRVLLERLKAEVSAKYVVASFKSVDELGGKVMQALEQLCRDKIIDCEGDAPDDDERSAALPKPPAPYVAHDYILTRKFVGRTSELTRLDQWAASADSTLIVDAIGGIGKSALTWQWFQDHAKDFDAAFWWSFYESDSAVTNFTRHALAYLEGKAIKDYDGTSADERERALLAILRKKRCLFVLDGLERILTAYHRMDAPHLLDEHAETSVPAAAGKVSDPAQLRRCTDPRHADLLKKLTLSAPSKFLISTRLIPADLQDPASGRLMPNVRELHLNGLTDADALALLRYLGIRGDEQQIKLFTRQFDNHSLLLGILAGKINEYDPAPGDFAAWHADEGRELRLQEVDIKQRRTHILAYALDGLPPEQRKLLAQIAAFRYPVDYATISAFNPYLPPRPAEVNAPGEPLALRWARRELRSAKTDAERAAAEQAVARLETQYAPQLAVQQAAYDAYQQALAAYPTSPAYREGERRFRAAVKLLQARGLLQFDREAGRYDLHPVVRAFAFEDLRGDDKRATYERIRDHFEKLPPEDLDSVQEISQLRRSLEIYHALIAAGLLDRASEFYGSRLSNILSEILGTDSLIIELLTPLFGSGIFEVPTLSNEDQQAWRMLSMAGSFYQVGRYADALKLGYTGIKFSLDHKRKISLINALNEYAKPLLTTGRLAHSLQVRRAALSLAEAAESQQNWVHLGLLYVYGQIGDWLAGEAEYQLLLAKPEPEPAGTYLRSGAERYYAQMKVYAGGDVTAVLARAWSVCSQAKHGLDQRVIHQLRGEVAVRELQPQRALEHFNDALTMLRQSGVGGRDLLETCGGLARVYALLGRADEARRLIEEGVDDTSAAEALLTLGDHAAARQRALIAYKEAWADGEPYVFRWRLERAKAVLAKFGVEPPALPAFDPAKVEPMPYEAEIKAFIAELQAKKANETDET